MVGVLLAAAGCSSDETGSAKISVSVAALSSTAPNVARITVVANMTGQPQLSLDLTNNGSSWTGTMTQIPAGNSWVFTGTAFDASDNPLYTGQSLPVAIVAQQTATVLLELSSVNPPPPFGNHAPHIDSIYISNDQPQAGEAVQLVVGATDPDTGDQAALVYAWTGDTGGVFTAASSATTGWSAATDGHYNVTIDVTDPHSAFDQVSFGIDVLSTEGAADISVQFNEAPQVLDIVASTGHLQPGVDVNVVADVTDDDPGTLTYAWTADCGGTFAADPMNPNPTAAVYTPPSTTASACTLTLTVTDAQGVVNTGALTIVVGADPVPGHGHATAIATGDNHTCAVVDGSVWCWGANYLGQLGDGTFTSSAVPVKVPGLDNVTAVTAGYGDTCAIAGGRAYCWGRDYDGELGDGAATGYIGAPVAVVGLPAAPVTAISAGTYFTCAIVQDTVYCWGADGSGQLGDNGTIGQSTGDSYVPVAVSLGGTATSITTGDNHACAIVDGGAICWGLDNYGQLGDTTSTYGTSLPVAPTNLAGGVSAIDAGVGFTCAIVSDSTMCWGEGDSGQVGDGNDFQSNPTPVSVYGTAANDASMISTGALHTCAAVGGGAVCWGYGGNGELGDGNGTTSPWPVHVTGVSGVQAVAAGDYHSCAITDVGIKCWGYNGYGQLGDGTTVNHLAPVSVGGL